MPEGGLGIKATDIVTAFTTATGTVLEMMAGLLPVGLGVFATIWGVRKAMQFFKGTTAA